MTVATYDHTLALRAVGSAAITSTTSETGIQVDMRYMGAMSWVIDVTALDAASADETYVFTLQVSDAVGGTYTTIASHTWPRAVGSGKVVIPIGSHTSVFQDTDSDWVRVTATLGGTTPSLTYNSYLCKDVGGNLGTGTRVKDTNRWT